MRHHASTSLPPPEPRASGTRRGDWQTIRTLLPYLWQYRVRVLFFDLAIDPGQM